VFGARCPVAMRLYLLLLSGMEARKNKSGVRHLLTLAYARPTSKERRERIESTDLPGVAFDVIVLVAFTVLAVIYFL
jgi:hypothetical protein